MPYTFDSATLWRYLHMYEMKHVLWQCLLYSKKSKTNQVFIKGVMIQYNILYREEVVRNQGRALSSDTVCGI